MRWCALFLFSKKEFGLLAFGIGGTEAEGSSIVGITGEIAPVLGTDKDTAATSDAEARINVMGIGQGDGSRRTELGTGTAIRTTVVRFRTEGRTFVWTVSFAVAGDSNGSILGNFGRKERLALGSEMPYLFAVSGIGAVGSDHGKNAMATNESRSSQRAESLDLYAAGKFEKGIVVSPVAIDDKSDGTRAMTMEMPETCGRNFGNAPTINGHTHDEKVVPRNENGRLRSLIGKVVLDNVGPEVMSHFLAHGASGIGGTEINDVNFHFQLFCPQK